MAKLLDHLRDKFGSFHRVLVRDLNAEGTRMASTSSAPDSRLDQPVAPTRATNGEVVAFSGAVPKVGRIVAAAERTVIKAQAQFNGHRDAADEGRRRHRAAAAARVPVPTAGSKVHREDATVVAGDSVVAGEAGAMADRLRTEVGQETARGWVGHLMALSPALKRLGVAGLTIDVTSLLFINFRTMNVGLSPAAFQRDPAGQLFGLVMSIGLATIAAIVMFILTRHAGRMTWSMRNAERGDQADPRVVRRSRWGWVSAGLAWALIFLLVPLVGFAVAQRLLHESESAGLGAQSSSLAILIGAVFAAGPIAFALGESFAASAKMQRVAALGSVASRLTATQNEVAREVLASENAADQVERHARTVVAIAWREAALARLAADQLIWAARARHGHLGDFAAPIVSPSVADGQLFPDISFDQAFAPLEQILQRMADRPAGEVPASSVSTPIAPQAVHLTTAHDSDGEQQAA